jgi:hypothetical protein
MMRRRRSDEHAPSGRLVTRLDFLYDLRTIMDGDRTYRFRRFRVIG